MKRLFGIRHLRFVWHCYRCHRFAQAMGALGLGLGHPHPHDLAHLAAILRGEA